MKLERSFLFSIVKKDGLNSRLKTGRIIAIRRTNNFKASEILKKGQTPRNKDRGDWLYPCSTKLTQCGPGKNLMSSPLLNRDFIVRCPNVKEI